MTNIYIYNKKVCQSLFTLFPFPFFLWLSFCLSFLSFLSFLPSFLSFFLFLISFFCCCLPKNTQIFIKQKPFLSNVCLPFFPFTFFLRLSVFLPLKKLSCLPSLLSLPFFLLFLLCSSFFPSFLVSRPSLPFQAKEAEEGIEEER